MGSKSVQTVLGDIQESDVSATQMHEHLLLDYYPSRWGYEHILNDKLIAIEELERFKIAGGYAIFELTLILLKYVPLILKDGITEEQVHNMLVKTP
jgi:predicted metal-dependent phosphotriesterase family hydrolase